VAPCANFPNFTAVLSWWREPGQYVTRYVAQLAASKRVYLFAACRMHGAGRMERQVVGISPARGPVGACYFASGENLAARATNTGGHRVKLKPALTAFGAAAATAVALAGAPAASADTEVKWLGQPGELVDGTVIQHWTVSHLKPSTDVIPYQPVGTLWEATASDEAISGNATPIVSNLNARAKNGDTYRVLFGVATEQGVNPSTLAQGQKTSGKIYFDVTGERPDSVFYSSGGPDELLWLEAPPAPATGSTGGGAPSSDSTASPATSGTPAAATPETVGGTPADATPASATPAPVSLPEGSVGTPLPEGSVGTPLPEGAAAEPAPAPAAVAPAPEGNAGTPVPHGAMPAAEAPAGSVGTPVEGATPAPAPGAPLPTVVPAPPA
jgi:hypothetical protein